MPCPERVYGIPPEQVVGSSDKLRLEVRDGRLVLLKLPEIDLIDDKEAKPVVQKFSVGWDEALAKGWTVVSMQKDWHAIFPPAQK